MDWRNSDIYERKLTLRPLPKKLKRCCSDVRFILEIEGKHSEVYGTLDNSDMTIITNRKR
jgi:hypothetical protein